MRNKLMLVLVAAMALGSAACGMDKIEPGHVGILVPTVGSNSDSKSQYEIVRGRVYYNAYFKDLFKYPTFVQTVQWTAPTEEGAPDKSITVSSKEGTSVNFDVGLSVAFVDEKVPELFSTFRKPADELMDTYVRNQTREAINRVANTMPVIDIVGTGRPALQAEAKKQLEALLGTAFKVDNLSFLSNPRVSDDIRVAIQNVIKQQKDAETAEARVRLVEAEAQQKIAAARGDSAQAVIRATGQATANQKLQQSLTAELIEYEKAKRWNGQLPQVTGGVTPMMQIR